MSSAPRHRVLLPPIALVVVTLAAYASSLNNGFVWDDAEIVVGAPETRDIGSIGRVMLSPDEFPPYYRPLNRASYLLDYQLFGMDAAGFHAVSLLLQVAAVLACYALARRLFELRWPAFVAAALLSLHPIHVEAVAFITARNNVLATLFAMLSTALLVDAERRGSWARAIASGAAFFLGLLSKEPAFMALPFMAAWLLVPAVARRQGRGSAAWLAPHVAAVAAYLVLRSISLGGLALAGGGGSEAGLLSRLLVNAYTIPRYLGLVLLPRDLANFHVVPSQPLAPWLAIPWLAIVAAVAYLLVRPSVATNAGLLWFGLNLLPIANIVAIPTNTLVAERYLYAPAVGLWLIAADLARRLAGRVGARPVAVVASAAAIALFLRTRERVRDWHDDHALASSAARSEPRSAEAHYNLGVVLKDRGDLEGASEEWASALALDPSHARALTQLGTAAAVRGDLPTAEARLKAALGIDPTLAVAHYNLARVLELMGRRHDALQEYLEFLATTRSHLEVELASQARERVSRLRSGR